MRAFDPEADMTRVGMPQRSEPLTLVLTIRYAVSLARGSRCTSID